MGVSENSVPHCTQWFCWSLSLLNGYFIGNIPYFQTNPRLFDTAQVGTIRCNKLGGQDSKRDTRTRQFKPFISEERIWWLIHQNIFQNWIFSNHQACWYRWDMIRFSVWDALMEHAEYPGWVPFLLCLSIKSVEPRYTRPSHLVIGLLSRERLCSLELSEGSEGQAVWWRILPGGSCWAWRNLLTETTWRFAQESAGFEFQPEFPGCAEDVFFSHFAIHHLGKLVALFFIGSGMGKSMQTQGFNQTLDQIRLARSLQSLTFGDEFNQSLDEVILPINLKSLTFGNSFDQSLRHCKLPIGLQSLTFGQKFNQELEQVALSPEFAEVFFCCVGLSEDRVPQHLTL